LVDFRCPTLASTSPTAAMKSRRLISSIGFLPDRTIEIGALSAPLCSAQRIPPRQIGCCAAACGHRPSLGPLAWSGLTVGRGPLSANRPALTHAKCVSESRRANAAYVGSLYCRMAVGAGGSISSGVWSAAGHGRPVAIQKPGDQRACLIARRGGG
jgi:hypothetical protein